MTHTRVQALALRAGLTAFFATAALAAPATAGNTAGNTAAATTQWRIGLEQVFGQSDQAEPVKAKPKDLDQRARDLGHHELGRREAAARSLVAAGDAGARAVRKMCDAADPVTRTWARRVYGAVHGVQPETLERVLRDLRDRRGRNALELSQAIGDAGPGAHLFVQRNLRELRTASAENNRPASLMGRRFQQMDLPRDLLAVLEVQGAVARLAAGVDLGHYAADRVLALGPDAAEPLLSVARDDNRPTTERLHALWLHGQIGAPKAAAQLAALTITRDAAVREEALAGAVAAVTAESFADVAAVTGDADLEILDRLAAAFATRMDDTGVISTMQRGGPSARLAMLTLGHLRTDDAVDALAAAVGTRGRRNTGPKDLEALAMALSHCPGDTAQGALVRMFASAEQPALRAAALAGLRGRASDRTVRLCLAAGVFDTADEVRITATADIGHRGDKALAPALILAARQSNEDESEASRTSAVLARLFAGASDAPRTSAGLAPSRQLSVWERWLAGKSNDLHKDELPWLRSGREARRVIGAVRGRVQQEFFHFGETAKVETETLEQAAREGIEKVMERDGDGSLAIDGIERQILRRFLAQHEEMESGPLLTALGTLPFKAPVSDLIRLTNAAAGSMVASLGDPYSRVMPSNNPDGEPSWLPAELEGGSKTNGFRATDEGGRKVVDFVLYDTPAWHAGIRAGDEVVRIGDTFTAELDEQGLRKKMNEEADFQILRDGWLRPTEIHLVPSETTSRHLTTHRILPGKIGYVRLKQFEPGCSVEIEDAVSRMERDHGIQGLVLDLRNNPGGTVVDAVALVDSFVPAGKTITVMERRNGEDAITEVETSTARGSDRDYPLVVLVNRCSASASEMTSGALQGLGRATVIGETSFGKGIGQSGMAVQGFSTDTALGTSSSAYTVYLTILRYYLPEGRRSIHGIGVEPDIAVRRGGLKGSAHSKAERARQNRAFKKYVDDLLEDQRDLAIQLAANDAMDADRYPDLKKAHRRVRRYVELDDFRELVRTELRRRLLLEADDKDLFARLICDLENDRELREALEQLCPDMDLKEAVLADAEDGFAALQKEPKQAQPKTEAMAAPNSAKAGGDAKPKSAPTPNAPERGGKTAETGADKNQAGSATGAPKRQGPSSRPSKKRDAA